jgi:restriction system protein
VRRGDTSFAWFWLVGAAILALIGLVGLVLGGGWMALSLCAPLAYLLFLVTLAMPALSAVGRALDKAKKCRHGVRGAHLQPARCESCMAEARAAAARTLAERAEAAAREAQRRTEEAAKQAEEARHRQMEYEQHLKSIRLPSYLAQMDPREFELTVCEVYRRLGYDVRETPYGGDSGVDGYLRRDGKLFILQCKRVKGTVGQPEVRDLFGTMVHERAAGGIMVTTGNVSQQARAWMSGKPIQVVQVDELVQMIRGKFTESEVVPPKWRPRLRGNHGQSPV